MTTEVIIVLCALFLLAYVFDISSPITRIPPVILLLFLGWVTRLATDTLQIEMPDLTSLLPAFGTIGLILIVLEGSLDLELNASKLSQIGKASLSSFLPMMFLAALFTIVIHHVANVPIRTALLNSIPFCVISSAIAIPSVKTLAAQDREFVVYESSLSDVIGVMFFNFIALNEYVNAGSVGMFGMQLLVIMLISFVAVLSLSFLLSRITHHITFTPIILLVILVYMLSKVLHLPSLIFILVFGLFLGNLDELRKYKWTSIFTLDRLQKEVDKFREINIEATFLVRAIFFILFGYLMAATEILNLQTLPWSVGVVLLISLVRWVTLKALKMPASPLLFVAPRGLITILLFLAISAEHSIPLVNKSLLIQTVILSVIVMMIGIVSQKQGNEGPTIIVEAD